MLEILFIVFLFKKVKARAVAKNNGGGVAWLVPLFWFGGEFFGAIIAGLILAFVGHTDHALLAYPFALLGGLGGVGIVFLVVRNMPEKVLYCPECNWSFTKSPKFGVECKDCGIRLKVVDGKVSVVG